jgi:hypothetical protein
MKVKELIAKLQEVDPDLEVSITDGYSGDCYNTNNLETKVDNTTLDIGIGGNKI